MRAATLEALVHNLTPEQVWQMAFNCGWDARGLEVDALNRELDGIARLWFGAAHV